jgi:DNA polymerase-1
MLKIFKEGLDMHGVAAAHIFGVPYEEFEELGGYDRATGEYTDKKVRLSNGMTIKYMRDECTKTCSFASNYGGNWKTLKRTLDMEDEKLQQIFNGYVDTYKVLFSFMNRYGHDAITKGITRNAVGRFRLYGPTKWERLTDTMAKYFKGPSRKDDYEIDGIRRQGLNMPIQSLAADIVKRAMFRIHRELKVKGLFKVWGPNGRILFSDKPGACIINQVHDEIILNVDAEVAEEVAEIVSRNMLQVEEELLEKVPAGVSCHIGTTWADK